MDIRSDRNCHARYNLKYHLILVTKYRKPCITEDVFASILEQAERTMAMRGAEIIESAHEDDHIHMLISVPPQVKLSSLINSVKSTTARRVRKLHADHLRQYYWKPYFWSRSYMILSSGGAPIETIRAYIREQGTPEHAAKAAKRKIAARTT